MGAITVKQGRIEQGNFDDYPVLRMAQAPQVQTIIVPSTAPPQGIGEPGTPVIAPAVANAVFALTGQRLRSLPLQLG
jgi:isoquinoline 1-oxidoreductase beta subunit